MAGEKERDGEGKESLGSCHELVVITLSSNVNDGVMGMAPLAVNS